MGIENVEAITGEDSAETVVEEEAPKRPTDQEVKDKKDAAKDAERIEHNARRTAASSNQ